MAQALLLCVVALVAVGAPGWPGVRFATLGPGIALIGAGGTLGVAAARSLGRSLTPFPRPRPDGGLAASGPYRVVRHPMYTAVLLGAIGASLAGSPWALVPSAALAVLLDRKAAREERWLGEARPGYDAFMARVTWRFVPGIR